MNVQVENFYELVKQEWNYPKIGKGTQYTQIHLHASDMDVTGGTIQINDIDELAKYPDVKSVTISGLRQDTFEYFIRTYGKQLRFIQFFKNKMVEDWSLIGSLPQLEGMTFFHNQRIDRMWDMSGNRSLRALVIEDFTRLHDLTGVEKAPVLEWLHYGDAVWSTSVIWSLNCLRGTKIKRLCFSGKKIEDMDLSVIPEMKELEIFDFPTNLFSTEQVAWLKANCPKLEGRAIKPYINYMAYNKETHKSELPAVIIVGKRKPSMTIEGNEARIAKYVKKFEESVERYWGVPFSDVP